MSAIQPESARLESALRLRPMTVADLDAVTDLDRRAFGDSAWSRRHFEGEITESPISIFSVLCRASQSGEMVIGYFGTWHIVDQLHLCTFAVDPEEQGRGLGGLLLQCVFRLAQRLECSEILLEVRVSNAPARALYRTGGFAEQSIRRNMYSHPREDGVLMWRETPERLEPSLPLTLRWADRGGALSESWPAI